MFDVIEILPNVFHFSFKGYRTMVRHFLRFQEYWENPVFKNTIFTHEEYKEWYVDRYGKYDIQDSWAGCAMSQRAFEPFFDKEMKPNAKEKAILKKLKRLDGSKYFVITSVKGDGKTVVHEAAHALFATSLKYRRGVKEILATTLSQSTRDFIYGHLKKMAYGKERLEDETHAYIIDGITLFVNLTGERQGYTSKIRKEWKKARRLLLQHYKNHVGKNEQED